MTLTEVLTGGAIIAVVSLSVTAVIIGNRSAVSRDLRVDSARRLNASTGEVLRDAGFAVLVAECQRLSALNQKVKPSVCVGADERFVDAPVTPANQIFPLQRRVNGFGSPAADGDLCTEILNCKVLASGRLLEVHYATYWSDLTEGTAARASAHMIRVIR